MAKRSPNVVGLDIEPGSVHAATVAVNGTIAIKDAAMVGLDPGTVSDGEVVDGEALSRALRELFGEHRSLPKRVRVGIANQKIVTRIVELPPIADGKELEAAVRFGAQESIPMPLDQAVLDYQALGIVETANGPRQRVVLVAARRDMVQHVLDAVRGAGLRPEGIDLAAFGMVRALHDVVGDAAGEAVAYLSVGGVTNLAVAEGTTCLFTRAVPGGVEAVATDLAERRGSTLAAARGWLTQIGLEGPVDDDADPDLVFDARQALQDGTRRIAGAVRDSLHYHATNPEAGAAAVGRVVLTGPATAIAGFAGGLEAHLGLPVLSGLLPGPAGLDLGRYTVAAGLALEEARR